MKENTVEYGAIRNEIIRLQESITNETIYMYVTYITLFSIGFSYNWAFLASFIVLIVFQAIINENQWELKKCSVFLKVFFEEPYDDIHWESFHTFKYYKTLRNIRENKIGWKLYKWSSSFLALVSLIFLAFTVFKETGVNISISEILVLLASLCFFLLTLCTNTAFNYKEGRDDDMLKDCVEEYLKSINSENK